MDGKRHIPHKGFISTQNVARDFQKNYQNYKRKDQFSSPVSVLRVLHYLKVQFSKKTREVQPETVGTVTQ